MAVNIEDKAAKYYAKGWWSIDNLIALADKGKLSDDAIRRITGTEFEGSGYQSNVFAGMTVAEVQRSLNKRATLDELRQACDWLNIPWDDKMTRAQLRSLIEAAAES